MSLTHLSLFSGIGGLDLAAEAAGFVTVGQCEWADYPTKILERHWPDVPRWRDIRTLTKESFYEKTGLRTVDVISGGFPCQPFSVAGNQKGKDDDRYFWPEMLRVIRELTPRWVLGENVPGILRIAAWDVVSGLEREGFDAVVFDFETAAVGALHRRERIAFVANRQSERRHYGDDSTHERHTDREIDASSNASMVCGARPLADPGSAGLQRLKQHGTPDAGEPEPEPCGPAGECGEVVPYSCGERRQRDARVEYARFTSDVRPQFRGAWATEPDVGRVAHGVPNRVDRIKCLGNAVVPQQFYPFFAAIAEVENN